MNHFCRYNENLNGVVLAYSDEKVVSQTALVHPYFPLARLIVSATLVVFRPYPGARLIGIVNKLSDDFIGVVVMGFMNVVIKAPEVRSDLKSPVFGSSSWVSTKNPGHEINVGDSIAFRVVEVKHEGAFVTLTGSLKEKDTGNIQIVGVAVQAAKVKASTKKDKDREKSSKPRALKRKKEEEKNASNPSDEEDEVGIKAGKGVAAASAEVKQTADGDKKKRRREKDKKDSSVLAAEVDNKAKGNDEDANEEVSKKKKRKRSEKGAATMIKIN